MTRKDREWGGRAWTEPVLPRWRVALASTGLLSREWQPMQIGGDPEPLLVRPIAGNAVEMLRPLPPRGTWRCGT